jgi:hypothetical protein
MRTLWFFNSLQLLNSQTILFLLSRRKHIQTLSFHIPVQSAINIKGNVSAVPMFVISIFWISYSYVDCTKDKLVCFLPKYETSDQLFYWNITAAPWQRRNAYILWKRRDLRTEGYAFTTPPPLSPLKHFTEGLSLNGASERKRWGIPWACARWISRPFYSIPSHRKTTIYTFLVCFWGQGLLAGCWDSAILVWHTYNWPSNKPKMTSAGQSVPETLYVKPNFPN